MTRWSMVAEALSERRETLRPTLLRPTSTVTIFGLWPLRQAHRRMAESIRGNRDTLYSTRVFDLDAGPATISLPDAGKRFMSLQIISEDQYTTTEYGAGPHTLDKARIGTRYALAGVRTLVDPNDPEDLKRVHALQDAIQVSQPGGPGKFEIPNWDKVSQKKVRDALLVLATTVTDTRRAFGTKEEVDPVQYLIGAASAWGANAPRDAIYLNVVPPKNDGETNYELKVKQVPSTVSGRSASTTPRAITRRTRSTRTRSTTSPRKRRATSR